MMVKRSRTPKNDNSAQESHERRSIFSQGLEWAKPIGKIMYVVGDPIYISSFGEHLNWKAYLDKYGVDPEVTFKGSEISNKTNRSHSEHTQADHVLFPLTRSSCKNCGAINEFGVGGNELLQRANYMLETMTSTLYSHNTFVDEADGIYILAPRYSLWVAG